MSPNTARLRRARAVLSAYVEAYPDAQLEGALSQEEVMTDLLSDLAHLCRIKHLDFGKLTSMAAVNAEAEKGGRE